MMPADEPASPTPAFAHASEAELARILDFYDVRWQYEPHTFPILWSLDGAVIESFSPDFFLPDLDLYLELTTLKQSLVRKKNRKLRRLRELYPDIRIKLFYARDFRQLLLKFGRVALVGELSGTSGQVVPDRLDGRLADDDSLAALAGTVLEIPTVLGPPDQAEAGELVAVEPPVPALDEITEPTTTTARRHTRRRRRRRPARTTDALAPPR